MVQSFKANEPDNGSLPRYGACRLVMIAACALLPNTIPIAAVAQENLPVFTSPIDITGFTAQLHAIAPDRNTGRPIEVSIPPGVLPPKFGQLLATPLSAQFDQYWAVTKDPKTGMTPKDQACTGPEGISVQIQDQIQKISKLLTAYDVSCGFASTGQLLLHQENSSTLLIAYQLTNNKIDFSISTPVTCHAGHGTPICPTDPHISVTFAMQIVTKLSASTLCGLSASDATVVTQAVTIDGNHNLVGAVATAVDDLFLGHKISAVERSIENTEKQRPSPLDGAFQELRNSCASANSLVSHTLQGFTGLETSVERRAIVFRATYGAIPVPTLNVTDPGASPQPTFFRPAISTNQPIVRAGASVAVSGRSFPPFIDLATRLPVSFGHDSGRCVGGGTDLQWGPANKPKVQRLPATAQAPCASGFDATGLTPVTAYQFSARDCDVITCSLWSRTVRVTTAKIIPSPSKLVLTLDGSSTLAEGVVSDRGAFDINVTIPAATPAGTHKIRAADALGAAEAAIGVTSATVAGGKASMIMVGILPGESGCPNHPISSTETDANFLLFGSGFGAGAVAIHLDNAAGFSVGSATAQANGSFCQKVAGVPSRLAGNHLLVAVQDGAIRAQAAVTFVVVLGPH
jgi:hypothetical protein